jgi:hypothetical protein
VCEETLVEELFGVLQGAILSDQEDRWSWKHDVNGDFSMKSTYSLVFNLMAERGSFLHEQAMAFKAIWKCSAPSKVQGFSWLLLHDRIPSKVNLFRRNIIQQVEDRICVLCGNHEESSTHMFLYCEFAIRVWERITSWLRLVFSLPHSCVSFVNYFAAASGNKKVRQGLVLIWNSVIWMLWRHRNCIIFENGIRDVAKVVEDIKVSSWKWWIGRANVPSCLLYEWMQEPRVCIAS